MLLTHHVFLSGPPLVADGHRRGLESACCATGLRRIVVKDTHADVDVSKVVNIVHHAVDRIHSRRR